MLLKSMKIISLNERGITIMIKTVETTVTPVLKWAGGKRQLVPIIKQMMPESYNRYYEPFFGGGALFCDLSPQSATINDFNKQLIGMYEQIKIRPEDVCATLFDLQEQYNKLETMEDKDTLYYKFRQSFNDYLVENEGINDSLSAALLIFLNKAGFNGLYRVNSSGLYNVPSAHRKTIKAYNSDNIKAISKILKKTKIMCGDFEKACKDAKEGDFVFFDSPYYDTFDAYQAGGFSEEDHMRLFNLFKRLSNKDVYCMMTNNDCDYIKNLYREFNIKIVDVKRMINSNAKNRTGKEVIVTNYEVEKI